MRGRGSYFIAVIGWLVVASLAHAQLALSGLAIELGSDGAQEVHLSTSGSIAPRKAFTLANPDRAVIDLPVSSASNLTVPAGYTGGLVKAVRFGRFDPNTSRLVLDVTVPVKITTRTADNELVLVLTPLSPVPVPSTAPVVDVVPPQGTQPGAPVAGGLTTHDSPFTVLNTPSAPDKADNDNVPLSPVVPESKKPLIFIDAGHGGQDPGALGIDGTHEKDVTLSYALALRDALLRTGRYRVGMTREDDRFIMLRDRVAIARKMKADLFISFHADSNPRVTAQGLSIYTLSENASDDEAAALAERENKADVISGLNLNTTDDDVASILIDLAQRETMNKSAVFADTLAHDMHPKVQLLEGTHRFAGFRVLKAPDVPSLLIELGFLSNPRDARLLHSHEYQSLVVASVVKALDDYRGQQKL